MKLRPYRKLLFVSTCTVSVDGFNASGEFKRIRIRRKRMSDGTFVDVNYPEDSVTKLEDGSTQIITYTEKPDAYAYLKTLATLGRDS